MDLATINCMELFKAYGGSNASGRLRLYQLNSISNEPDNPYELPSESSTEPFLILDTEVVSIKEPFTKSEKRESAGFIDTSIWRVTISGDIDPNNLKLKSYAFVDWGVQRIKGVLDNVERKHSNRYHLLINVSQNVPFSIPT